MSIETELKLTIAPEDVEKLMQQPLLQNAVQHPPQQLYNTYFDTPEYDLLKAGIGLRVRRQAGKYLQSLKTTGQAFGGLHQRQEWEDEVQGELPEYEKLPPELLPTWLVAQKKKAQNIQSLFTTDFIRSRWDLTVNDQTTIELVLDQGEIKTSEKTLPLCEIELELKQGDIIHLFQVALTLQQEIPLVLENKSKAARGYALYRPQPLSYYKAEKIGLEPKMRGEDSFIQIIWHCLSHLQKNEDMVLYGEDIEGVHQMRVALRRLRSTFNLYQNIMPKKVHAELSEELKWLGSILGVARDWDVFNENLEVMQAHIHNSTLLTDFQKISQDFQAKAYAVVRKTLYSSRYTRLLLRLSAWVTEKAWQAALDEKALKHFNQPLKSLVEEILQSRYDKVCKKGKKLASLSPEKRHQVRIMVKKLGYGAKFFAEIYPDKKTKPFLRALNQLQDELGILNDNNVAMQLLDQAGIEPHAPVRYFLNGWYAHEQMVHHDNLAIAWQHFKEQQPFWQ